jgi:hypothetical protein
MAKRKARRRAPGGGRKPAGDFSHLTAVTSFRMPAEMREQLEKAAKARSKETNRRIGLSQELLRRLAESFDQDRRTWRDPATRALCFLISELAETIGLGQSGWRSDPFLFRAFKVGVAKLLDNIPQPAGKIETPEFLKFLFDHLGTDPVNKTEMARKLNRRNRERIARIMKSPEALGEDAAETTLSYFFRTEPPLKGWEPLREELEADRLGRAFIRHQQNIFYGMENARRDLAIPQGEKS